MTLRATTRSTIDAYDAATVCGLLRDLGDLPGRRMAADLRDAATFWASQIHPGMQRGDLQTIAWLLRDASDDLRVPGPCRDEARYWAAYLEGRLAR